MNETTDNAFSEFARAVGSDDVAAELLNASNDVEQAVSPLTCFSQMSRFERLRGPLGDFTELAGLEC